MVFVLYFGIFFLAFYAPTVQHFAGYPAGESIYAMFSPICHQYPTRSFWIFNRPWALCARCSSAYLGIALTALFLRLRLGFLKRAAIGALIIVIVAIDPIFQLLGFYESTNYIRLTTGLVGGLGAFLLLYPIPLKHKEKNQ